MANNKHAFKVFNTQTGEYVEDRRYYLDGQGDLRSVWEDSLHIELPDAPSHLVPHFPADIHRRNMELREGETEVDMLNRVFPVGSKVWVGDIERGFVQEIIQDRFRDLDQAYYNLACVDLVDDLFKYGFPYEFSRQDLDYNREHPILE